MGMSENKMVDSTYKKILNHPLNYKIKQRWDRQRKVDNSGIKSVKVERGSGKHPWKADYK